MSSDDQDDLSPAQSALGGLQSGSTLGFAPAIAGISGAAGAAAGGSQDPFWDTYRQARDEYKARQANLKQTNPKSYALGNAGSAMVTGPALATSNIPLIATLGALGGVGHSNADLTKGEVGPAALDALKGGVLSAGMGMAMPAIANSLTGKVFRSPESAALLRAKTADVGNVAAPVLSSEGNSTVGQLLSGPDAQKVLARKLSQIRGEPIQYGDALVQPTQSWKP